MIRIDQQRGLTVLDDLGLYDGSLIHLQDSRLLKQSSNDKSSGLSSSGQEQQEFNDDDEEA